MNADIIDQPDAQGETMNATASALTPLLGPITFRMAVIALLAVTAVFQAATWFENWSMNNITSDQMCFLVEYVSDGAPAKALGPQEQELNDIYGCGLDLPLDKSDPNTE
jgi:hypothetical protein